MKNEINGNGKQITEFRSEMEKIVEVYIGFSLVWNSLRQIKSGAYEGRIKFTDWMARLLLINHRN